MYRDGGEGGNLSDRDAAGAWGGVLEGTQLRGGLRLLLILERLLAQEKRTRSAEKVHAGRNALKCCLVRFSYAIYFGFIRGGFDLRQGTVLLHRSKPQSAITQDI